MREHGIDERNTYNMDEKGFFVGIAKRTKRIFSKAVWESKELKSNNATLQPHKDLTIHLKDASEQPHTKQLKFQQSVVAL